MKKLFFWLFIVGGFSQFCQAETITITTYYPAPYGAYNELTTTGNTYLARDSGKVGIGTGTTTLGSEKVRIGDGTSTDLWLNLFGQDSNAAPLRAIFGTLGTLSSNEAGFVGTATQHRFDIRTGNSAKVTVLNNGYVGIGTTAATAPLHISKTTETDLLKLTNNYANLIFAIDSSSNASINQYNAAPLIFKTNNTEAMRILSNGNVGIGITNPSKKLEINGDLKANSAELTGKITGPPTLFTKGSVSGTVPFNGANLGSVTDSSKCIVFLQEVTAEHLGDGWKEDPLWKAKCEFIGNQIWGHVGGDGSGNDGTITCGYLCWY